MNYIHQLQTRIAELEAAQAAAQAAIQELRQHLALAKFDWPDNYISTVDLAAWVAMIDQATHAE